MNMNIGKNSQGITLLPTYVPVTIFFDLTGKAADITLSVKFKLCMVRLIIFKF
jgi:hypothetical protein